MLKERNIACHRSMASRVYRKDECGAWIQRNHYRNRDYVLGYEIDHKPSFDKGGTDELSNLRLIQWKDSVTKRERRLTCPAPAAGNIDRSKTTEANEGMGNPRWEICVPTFRLDRWFALAREGKNLALKLSFRGEAISQAVVREVWDRVNRSVPDKPMPDVRAFVLDEKDFNELVPRMATVDFDFHNGYASAHMEEQGTPVSLREGQTLAFVVFGISIDRSVPNKFVILINEKYHWSLEEILEHELDRVYDKISWSESSPFVEKLREAVDRLKAGRPLRLMSSASVAAITTATQRSVGRSTVIPSSPNTAHMGPRPLSQCMPR